MNQPFVVSQPQVDYRARFSSEEFTRMAEAGAFENMKVELVDGGLERMTPPMKPHATMQARVMMRLGRVVSEDLLCGDVGVVLGGNTIVACDVAVVGAPFMEQRMLTPADLKLVVEIAVATLDRDLGMKRAKYAAAGIPTYWVVDGEGAVVHVYRDPRDGAYAEVEQVPFGAALPVPGTDGTITLD